MNNSNYYDDDVPKYRKKQSSTSKADRKSKHKHEYTDCLVILNGSPSKSSYCAICGKLGDIDFFQTEKVERGYRLLTDDEIYKRYKGLEKFEIDSFDQKYINI